MLFLAVNGNNDSMTINEILMNINNKAIANGINENNIELTDNYINTNIDTFEQAYEQGTQAYNSGERE